MHVVWHELVTVQLLSDLNRLRFHFSIHFTNSYAMSLVVWIALFVVLLTIAIALMPSQRMNVANQHWLITGGSSGIGWVVRAVIHLPMWIGIVHQHTVLLCLTSCPL